MADSSPTRTSSAANTTAFRSDAEAHQEIQRALALGVLPVEDEVKMRTSVVNYFIQVYDRSGELQYIHDAIQHLDAILRRLPRDSLQLPKYLARLSHVKMSEYLATNSRHALNESVLNGRRAQEMAVSIDLLHLDPNTYFEILTDYGYALAQRYALLRQSEDLEGAITCAKGICENASKDSWYYYTTLNNLASRLRMRYALRQDENDINEAMRLINELQSMTTPGTSDYMMAVIQLGAVAADKFKQTNQLEDLDQALQYCKTGLDGLSTGHEMRVSLLREIVELYRERYQKTSNVTDLRNLATYSGMLFHATPSGHSVREKYLVSYVHQLYKLATSLQTLEEFQKAVQTVQPILESMPTDYSEQSRCWRILADLLLEQYFLSHNTRDLLGCMDSVQKLTRDYNDSVERSSSGQGLLEITWIWDFRKFLQILIESDPSNQMRRLAEDELPAMLELHRKTDSYAGAVLEHFYRKNGVRLTVLGEAIATGQILSEEEITRSITELEEKKANADSERQRRRRLKTDDYTTELGLRKLAMNESKNIILDMSGLMSEILGYDVTKPYSEEEFAAMAVQGEQKALEEARAKGRHPNTSLCRMCRDHGKLLHPIAGGFELTAKNALLPFGNFFQLRERRFCAICSLILSTISTSSGKLHPRFAAIDREVQGIRLSAGILSTNEHLIRFDYGLEHAGELRLVTQNNFSQVLRQAWELDPRSSVSRFLDDSNSAIYDSSQQQIDPNLVRWWLNRCDNNHGTVCNHPRSGKRAENVLRLVLIDVKTECLVSASSDRKYFVLSYVWGQVNMFKTLKSNYDERTRPGALAAILFPKTIRDAMQFVRSLGETYLWVDAICLVQDDEEQMARDVLNMDIIYGQAFATLVALEGTNADAGLPGVRAGTREPQKLTTISISNKSADLDDDPDSENRETIYLTATPRSLHLALELSQWSSRCWIVQEHLLSKRCLFFAPDAVYFQCGKETLSEGGANEVYEAMKLKVPLNDSHILEKLNRNNPLPGLDVFYDLPTPDRIPKAFNAYAKLVGIYSQRNLSFKSDILNAFAGMFAVLEEHFEGTTVYGLPSSVISHALLWSPCARLPRRGSHLPTNFTKGPEPDPQFPSWSWAGWDGPVEYRLFELSKNTREIVLPVPRVKEYNISSGPISDIIRGEDDDDGFGPSDQDFNSPQGESSTQTGENDQKPATSDSTEQKEPHKERILAKMVPDHVRQTTWLIGAPQVTPNRKDLYIDRKLLRFTARTVPVPAFQISPTKEYLSSASQVHIRTAQAVRRIYDRNGRHCGLWWEQAGYGYVGLGISPEAESKIDMLEISRYGDAYRPRDGPYLVEGPISIFDDETFPAVGRGSELVNILVVDLDMGLPDGIGERCTVAVIHATAWEAANPQEKEVRMV